MTQRKEVKGLDTFDIDFEFACRNCLFHADSKLLIFSRVSTVCDTATPVVELDAVCENKNIVIR